MVLHGAVAQTAASPAPAFERARGAADIPILELRGAREAAAAIEDHILSLRRRARERLSLGLPVADQDYPDTAFRIVPPTPCNRPLAIIGGMGPLAGALAFRAACERFGDTRVIVLHQACSVPDRTPVIAMDRENGWNPSDHAMAAALANAIAAAVDLVPDRAARVDCVIACNSAHFFWQLLKTELASFPRIAQRVNLISAVDSAMRVLRVLPRRPVLILCTQGSRLGRVFSSPAAKADIRFTEPTPELERLLMRTIYEGPKSLDERRAVELGTMFFDAVARGMTDIGCILAGCTELPPTLELLRERSTPTVRSFLARVDIVDPMDAALAVAGLHLHG